LARLYSRVLCETVRDMIGRLGVSSQDAEIDAKCATLSQKLDSLLQTLHEETANESYAADDERNEQARLLRRNTCCPLCDENL